MGKRIEKMLGSRLFTGRQVLDMYLPLLLDQLFIFAMSVLSTAMVSTSGKGAMATMNLVLVLGNIAFAIYTAFAIGGGIVVARAKGAGDTEKIRRATGQTCTICFITGVVLGGCLILFGEEIVRFLYPDVGEEITLHAANYLRYLGMSIFPYALYTAIFNAIRSIGDTKTCLKLTVVLNFLHLVFSLIYINFWGMGVEGSGLSLFTCRSIAIVVALIVLFRKIPVRIKDFGRFDKTDIKEIMQLSLPLGMEQLMFYVGMLLVEMYIAKLPVAQMDAEGVANAVFNMFYAFSYSLINLTSTICGQCVGAGSISLCRFYTKGLIKGGRLLLAAAVVALLPITPFVFSMFNPSPESYPYIWKALLIGVIALPIMWPEGYITASATRAAGDSMYTTFVCMTALAVGRMCIGYLLAIRLGMGIPGVWLGQCVEWVIRGVLLTRRMKGNAWVKTTVAEETADA